MDGDSGTNFILINYLKAMLEIHLFNYEYVQFLNLNSKELQCGLPRPQGLLAQSLRILSQCPGSKCQSLQYFRQTCHLKQLGEHNFGFLFA